MVKGKTLHPLNVDHLNGSAPSERKFRSVKEIEEFLRQFSKFLFGQHGFVILPSKATANLFGTDEPSFFLLDFSGDQSDTVGFRFVFGKCLIGTAKRGGKAT